MQQKQRILPQQKSHKRKGRSQVERAYSFFARAEKNHRIFTDEQIRRATDYTPGTIHTYHSKKWASFVKVYGPGEWYCENLCTHDEFVDLHKQARIPGKNEKVKIVEVEVVREVYRPIRVDERIWIVLIVLAFIRFRRIKGTFQTIFAKR